MKRFILMLIMSVSVLFAITLSKSSLPISAENQTEESQLDNKIYLPLISNNTLMVNWVFEETFDGDPSAPSQALLPNNFDFAVTHRTLYTEHFDTFDSFPADHNNHCDGPDPHVNPLPQHEVVTSHFSNGANLDKSFFICKNHMMSSMGHVSDYTVTSFWPRQEFDFSNNGYLEFDVNINNNHPRSWFEVMITPRTELKVAAAPEFLPIDETYPKDRIVLRYFYDQKRLVQIGTGAIDPLGIIAEKEDSNANVWNVKYPNDPALTDPRIRRTMRVALLQDQLIWSIEKADGSFDDLVVDIPGVFPFTRGLVVFKTHAYTPEKDGNYNNYTFHWDNLRFSGPLVGRYENFEANDVVYLQHGNSQIGDKETVTVDLPHIGPNPVVFGQVHSPMSGQVLLSINGRSNITVHPYDYNPGTCSSTGWKSFQLKVNPTWLVAGRNTFTWTIGPRPNCAESFLTNGFSVKDLEIQFDTPN